MAFWNVFLKNSGTGGRHNHAFYPTSLATSRQHRLRTLHRWAHKEVLAQARCPGIVNKGTGGMKDNRAPFNRFNKSS